LGWVTFSILTGSYTAYFFTVLSVLQMAQWAKDKHIRYQKEFKDAYPKGRKAMFPFIF
jgi:very-long-chain enoyl-CoA reductase